MKGILADANIRGPVDRLVRQMQTEPWAEFWNYLGLVLVHFEDIGLVPASTDLQIWQWCQTEQLILITNNRNARSPESLEATIRRLNTADSLPVFTISNLDRLRSSPIYAEKVVKKFYDYLLSIENFRGTGRLYLP